MAAKINFGKLSDKELKALKQRIENELKTSKTRAIATATQELHDAVQKIARKHGLNASEVLGKKRKPRTSPLPAKYQNPDRGFADPAVLSQPRMEGLQIGIQRLPPDDVRFRHDPSRSQKPHELPGGGNRAVARCRCEVEELSRAEAVVFKEALKGVRSQMLHVNPASVEPDQKVPGRPAVVRDHPGRVPFRRDPLLEFLKESMTGFDLSGMPRASAGLQEPDEPLNVPKGLLRPRSMPLVQGAAVRVSRARAVVIPEAPQDGAVNAAERNPASPQPHKKVPGRAQAPVDGQRTVPGLVQAVMKFGKTLRGREVQFPVRAFPLGWCSHFCLLCESCEREETVTMESYLGIVAGFSAAWIIHSP